jgi:hypothetical protein
MERFNERRKFRRFEIPGGKARYKKIVQPGLIKHFSKSYLVMNLGVGGLSMLCGQGFRNGETVILQLTAPGEKPMNLRSIVIWQNPIALSNDMIVGFEFVEFGSYKDLNSPEALNVLRRLYARYIEN